MKVVALALLVLAGTAHADDRPKHRTTRALIAGGAEVVHALISGPLLDRLAPDHCRWCDSNALDRGARRHLVWARRDRAQTLSNVSALGTAMVAASLLSIASLEAPRVARRFAEDALPVFEAYVYTELLTAIVKLGAGRERPDAHFRDEQTGAETNLSFYSGHTSIAFTVAVASSLVAQRRGYRLAPAIWASTLALATTTAYLRIAGDRHYLTDVATGAVVGTLGGYAIPTLMEGRNLAVVPTGSGATLAGAF